MCPRWSASNWAKRQVTWPDVARLVVVGSGTVVPEADRGGSCYYIEAEGSRILMDCGPGAVQSLARLGIPWAELTDLVVSHFHTDHVGALPGLFFGFKHGIFPARTTESLDIWGPAGTADLFDRLAAALGSFFVDPGFPVRIHELQPGHILTLSSGIRISAHETPHTAESIAVRLDGADVSVGYTGDTGPSETLGGFMRGVHTLICECSLRDTEVSENHLSPARVARIARAARPELLILSHIYPHFRASEDVAALVRHAGYSSGRIELAADGRTFAPGLPDAATP